MAVTMGRFSVVSIRDVPPAPLGSPVAPRRRGRGHAGAGGGWRPGHPGQQRRAGGEGASGGGRQPAAAGAQPAPADSARGRGTGPRPRRPPGAGERPARPAARDPRRWLDDQRLAAPGQQRLAGSALRRRFRPGRLVPAGPAPLPGPAAGAGERRPAAGDQPCAAGELPAQRGGQ